MKKIIFYVILLTSTGYLFSQTSYRILSKGTVRDNTSMLLWTRCPISDNGKPIQDFNCQGVKKQYSWSEAISVCENLVHEGRSDWRLPNLKELQSILYYNHYAVDAEKCGEVVDSVFPNIVTAQECLDEWGTVHFWSSTTHTNDDPCGNKYAWFIDFKWGNTGFSMRNIYQGPPGFFDPWDEAACTKLNDAKKFVRCVAGP